MMDADLEVVQLQAAGLMTALTVAGMTVDRAVDAANETVEDRRNKLMYWSNGTTQSMDASAALAKLDFARDLIALAASHVSDVLGALAPKGTAE